MKKYKIVISETVSGEYEIEADSPEAAFQTARQKYRQGELVNAPGELQKCEIAIFDRQYNCLADFREI